jgi:hypothetical protein
LLGGLLIAAVLLTALLWWAGKQAWALSSTGVSASAWGPFLAGLCTSHVLRAARLHTEWRGTVGATFGECLAVSLQHNAAVNLLPLRGGELAYPWLIHRRWGVPLSRAAASLLALRVQDAVILALAAWLLWAPFAIAWRGIGAALGLGVAVAASGRPAAWACTAASWGIKLLAVGWLMSLLVPLPPADSLSGALAGELAAVLPLQAPGALGTYEAGVWSGVSWVGQASRPVVGAALVVHAGSWVVAMVGGLGALWWSLGSRGCALRRKLERLP